MAKSTSTTGFPLAVIVEGGVALAAVVLAWIFGVELRTLFPASVEGWTSGFLRGLVATLPMLLAFFWLAQSSRESLVKLREQVESMVHELFPTSSMAQFALVALLAGVGEELLFRGFVQSLLARWTSPVIGLVLGSLAFGAAHAVSRTYFALASIIGLFLGWLMLEYNDLVAPIVAHTVYDFLALIFIARNRARRPARDRAVVDDDSMDPGHPPMIKSITPQELHHLAQQQPIELVDVRTPEEFAEVRAQGARNVPLDLLVPDELARSRKLDREEPIYLICRLGGRSGRACEMMIAAGHPNVVNVDGGTETWVEAGLPVARGQ